MDMDNTRHWLQEKLRDARGLRNKFVRLTLSETAQVLSALDAIRRRAEAAEQDWQTRERLVNDVHAVLLECMGHERPCECGWSRALNLFRDASPLTSHQPQGATE